MIVYTPLWETLKKKGLSTYTFTQEYVRFYKYIG